MSAPFVSERVRIIRNAFAATCLVALASASLHAQAAAGKMALAGGVVNDSVRMRPLAGATVTVVGTKRSAVTNAKGQFAIDSIEPGEYQLKVTHPLLDTLGVDLVSRKIQFTAGNITLIDMPIPSAATLISSFCPEEDRTKGEGAVFGRILDAETGAPAVGAVVTAKWKEFGVDKRSWLQKVAGQDDRMGFITHEKKAVVGPEGVYRICGVPPDLNATIQVTRGKVSGGVVRVLMEGDVIALQTLRVGSEETQAPPGAVTSSGSGRGDELTNGKALVGPATLSGRIVAKNGKPVVGATVSVIGAASSTTTKQNGDFALAGLPVGTHTLVARRLGYEKVEQTVELSATNPQRVAIAFGDQIRTLAAVNVEAEIVKEGLALVGFSNRQSQGLGKYITPTDLKNSTTNDLWEYIWNRLPPPRQSFHSAGTVAASGGGGAGGGGAGGGPPGAPPPPAAAGANWAVGTCTIWYLDNMKVPTVDSSSIRLPIPLQKNEVAAVEVYQGGSVPAEYNKSPTCRVVLIWTYSWVGQRARNERERKEKK